MMNSQQAHERAMKHGWNIIKFFGPGYDPTQGQMAEEGRETLRTHGKAQDEDLERWSKTMNWGNERAADAISEGMNRREEIHPGIKTKNTSRMRPLDTPGKDSSYRRGDEEAQRKRGEPMRSRPREGESSFDTEGVNTGSIFDTRASWQGE